MGTGQRYLSGTAPGLPNGAKAPRRPSTPSFTLAENGSSERQRERQRRRDRVNISKALCVCCSLGMECPVCATKSEPKGFLPGSDHVRQTWSRASVSTAQPDCLPSSDNTFISHGVL